LFFVTDGLLLSGSVSTPKRNSRPEAIQSDRRTFHVQSSTWGKRSLLQSEAMATLLIDTLFHYREQGVYKLHAFAVMRDHFHALLTIEGKGTIERVMQKIKGGFSYRARTELGFRGEIWQRGFTDERVWDAEQFISVRTYIHDNPVRRGMVAAAEDYSFSSAHPKFRKPQGLKPSTS
jgi:putative transposase